MNFEKIYSDYSKKIFRLCMGYVNDSAKAKDLTQDTFIIVWQELDKFRHESNIGTWIYRIATNNCLKDVKKQKKQRTDNITLNIKEEHVESIEPQIKRLYEYISELPEIDRLIISLELEDVQQAEIAKIVGLKNTNVRVRIHRIKEKLSQKFKQHG